MNDYVIISDSTCDLRSDMAKSLNVEIIPMTFQIEGREYKNYLDEREMSLSSFYDTVRRGNIPTTSQISVNTFIDVIKPFLEEGKDCLVISFSSALSGTFNSLNVAKKMLEEEFPLRKIFIVDSKCASMGEGLYVYYAAKNRENNMSIEENAKWLEENKLRFHHWFTVDDIDHLKKGGRLTGAQAFFAKTLKIKPFLKVDDLGRLIAVKKVFGRKAAINEMIERFKEFYDGSSVVFLNSADATLERDYIYDRLKEIAPNAIIEKGDIGPVIGAHSGPGTLALFFLAKESGR